jgi:peptide/nickel transport system substrate-binding protein
VAGIFGPGAAGISFALLLALPGCGGPSSSSGHALPPKPLVAKGQPGQFGGCFQIAAPAGPRTFNPLFADVPADGIVRLLFGSLVEVNFASEEPGPGLAESWSVGPDEKTWTFKLRQGLRWSDGAPLTADDVVFTWNAIMYNPQYNQNTYDLFRIGGKDFEVSKLDDLTVRVVTPKVFAPFVEFFGGWPILPRHILENAARENRFPLAYGVHTPPNRLVGCGPYRLKEYRAGKYTLLERNPEYWVTDRQGRRLPYFDEVKFAVGHGPGVETRMLLEGQSDVLETIAPDDYGPLAKAAGRALPHSFGWRLGHFFDSTPARHAFRIVDLGVGSEREIFWFNQNTGRDAAGAPFVNPAKLKWFRDRRFRQAVSCALDRERMAREVYGGHAQPTYGFVSQENKKWYNPAIARSAYDPAKARALLAEMGIADRKGDGSLTDADGHPLEIVFNSNTGNPLREKSAKLIQEDLRKIGIKLIWQPIDFLSLVQKVNATFDYECAMMGLGGGGGDPASQMNVLRSSEDMHQWFPSEKTPSTAWEARIDQLMEAQMRTLDFARRKQCFDEVQAILAEELPMIYTVSPYSYAAIRADTGNLAPSVMTAYHLTWNLEELYFK